MKPFEDILPEEEGNYLVDLLQEEPRQLLELKPAEQEQIIQRIRERLLQTSLDALPEQEYDPGQFLMTPISRPPATRRQRLTSLVSSLVAILVVGVIITSALSLFIPQRTIMTGPPAGPVQSPGTTHVQAGGFEMTLGITQGPYFLGEMLEVNIKLTNHTSKVQWVASPFSKSACGYTDSIEMQENVKPAFELPPTDHRCPSGAAGHLQILPGHTLSTQKYFVLQWSGSITLTSTIDFLEQNNDQWYQPVKSPLEGHWPTLHLHVASQVPPDRLLTAHVTDKSITVDASPSAHLQYLFGFTCTNGPGSGSENTDNYGSGNYGWQPLKSTTVNRPACSMKHITWSYAIGVPGYAVATGNAQSDT
ncbi:hypothetical protein [Tengunoibacter tsumagoiensis]|uniref:Uncharacterized protein n=1 Tax=Tengunoibacter tsumagoiensis TaxID=2014871 RepID=A0A402A8S0_9CHLR|nr:hypothetical protein [Tengunoibacter tsumagoiensis]GCE15509.1 hypothetical protein KTT_53680 [Tengunoibacter tsumagoiensis]